MDQTKNSIQLDTMDEFNIYVNVDGPWENTYGYMHEDKIQEPNRIGPALTDMQTGAKSEKKSWCRAAAVCLGLLCLLLLTGLITLVFLYIKGKMEMTQLYNSYNNLTDERNQLQTDYNKLANQKDQLQKRLEDMTKGRNVRQSQGWVNFRGSSYSISSREKTWQESRDDCQRRGADLVIINSKEEQQFINSFKKRVWIGLTDREREGTWKWVDGTPLKTSYWTPSEPNGVRGRDEDCAEVKNYDLPDSWNDDLCNLQSFWICERKPL